MSNQLGQVPERWGLGLRIKIRIKNRIEIKRPRLARAKGRGGYALLDVVLAVALFAITVTGLLRVFAGINDTSSSFARDRFIQQQLEALLAEKRRVEIDAVPYEAVDPLSGITFRTYLAPLQLDNGEGSALNDLYLLTAEAAFLDDGGEQIEKAELIIHRPDS